jgi:hypothetical protein
LKSKVAIVKALPEQIHDAYTEALALAECQFPPSADGCDYLVPQILWRQFLPACGTTPWQLEGTILSLLSGQHSYKSIKVLYSGQNDAKVRATYKHSVILNRFGLPVESLAHGLAPFIAPNQDSSVPKHTNFYFLSTGVSHSLHYFGGAFWALCKILMEGWGAFHEDKFTADGCWLYRRFDPLHRNCAFIMDTTVAGEGPGPFCLRPRFPGFIFASHDPIALDTVFSLILGLDPMQTPLIKQAHDLKLGVTDMANIDTVGENLRDVESHYRDWIIPVPGGPLAAMERRAMRKPHSIRGRMARLVREWLWYPMRSNRRILDFLHNEWGFLWQCY